MQIIGDEIDWATFCSALNVTDGEARVLLHEMGHRHLAGFAGGVVTPSIEVVWIRRQKAALLVKAAPATRPMTGTPKYVFWGIAATLVVAIGWLAIQIV